MPNTPQPIPQGFHAVTPFLALKDPKRDFEFYKKAFDAKVDFEKYHPNGKLMHATFRVGDSVIMCSDSMDETQESDNKEIKQPPIGLFLYVPSTDEVYKRAIEAGARSYQEPVDAFWGDRLATIVDPSGHLWNIATHIEDVSPQDLDRRADEFYKSANANSPAI